MELIPRSEKELLRQAAEGNQASFSSLFHTYKHKLYGVLLRMTDSAEMTEDIIQDVFLKLWKNREELPAIEHFSAYLFRMAQNQALNAFKRRAREYQYIASLQEPITGAEAETNISLQEVKAKLESAVQQLPPKQKQVFTLSRDKGLKHEEIAREMNISPATVNNHMIEALRSLRKQIGPYLYTTGSYWLLLLISSFL
ncbi:RNA polymerase sigma factor [uncultured Chitinophaga sp.]|uniref:RNA polymerase sigma factor n=1 Tax=uncultured Chitinophaga sp. TaxID=339340 RepID=UPI0025CC7D38|nr:RNA polymerase sigma-70 factor [uncultured Chitinophaga sp.]